MALIRTLSVTVWTRLVVLFCLFGQLRAKDLPDVECLVVGVEYVQCTWNKDGTPNINYTFTSWFTTEKEKIDCTEYLLKEGKVFGCQQPYTAGLRFNTFYTVLKHDQKERNQEHQLKDKVKLYPPTNLTVEMGSDSNLWFYWNQTKATCVESEVQYRTNGGSWEKIKFPSKQHYCINLPSSSARYELQVRSRFSSNCGESLYWSDWSNSVVWRSNGPVPKEENPTSVWTVVLYVVGAITLILMVIMLVHHERLRIIPVVPKPSLKSPDVENWFQFSKGLMKDGFKANYCERACTVREYTPVSRSDSDSSSTSQLTVTTEQSDCSVAVDEPGEPCAPDYPNTLRSEQGEQFVSV